MEQILKTRKTVKQYVIFNLGFMCISIVLGVYIELTNNPEVQTMLTNIKSEGANNIYIFYLIVVGLSVARNGRHCSRFDRVLLSDLWAFIKAIKIELQRFERA